MRATEELTAELEILNAEKQEAESVIASVGAEIADAREEVEWVFRLSLSHLSGVWEPPFRQHRATIPAQGNQDSGLVETVV